MIIKIILNQRFNWSILSIYEALLLTTLLLLTLNTLGINTPDNLVAEIVGTILLFYWFID